MARRISRNIVQATLKGKYKEPLYTNVQNDILSDGEDVAIRNNNEYHILTDNIKKITSNDHIKVIKTGKNSVHLEGQQEKGSFPFVDLAFRYMENLESFILEGVIWFPVEKVSFRSDIKEIHMRFLNFSEEDFLILKLEDTGEENLFDISEKIKDLDFLLKMRNNNFNVVLDYVNDEGVKIIGNYKLTNLDDKEIEVLSTNDVTTVEKKENIFKLTTKQTNIYSDNDILMEVIEEGTNEFRIIPKATQVESLNDRIIVEYDNLQNKYTLELKGGDGIDLNIFSSNPDIIEIIRFPDTVIIQPVKTEIVSKSSAIEVVELGDNNFEINYSGGGIEIISADPKLLTVTEDLDGSIILNPIPITITSGNENILEVITFPDTVLLKPVKTKLVSDSTVIQVTETGDNDFRLNYKPEKLNVVTTDPNLLGVTVGVDNKVTLSPKNLTITSENENLLEVLHFPDTTILKPKPIKLTSYSPEINVTKVNENEYTLVYTGGESYVPDFIERVIFHGTFNFDEPSGKLVIRLFTDASFNILQYNWGLYIPIDLTSTPHQNMTINSSIVRLTNGKKHEISTPWFDFINFFGNQNMIPITMWDKDGNGSNIKIRVSLFKDVTLKG